MSEEKSITINWVGITNECTGYGYSSDEIKMALLATGVKLSAQAEIGVAYTPPISGEFDALKQNCRVLFTMFEADRWPNGWVDTCNSAHQVWVPSQFCKDTLIESGCDRPVHVVPLGVDTDQYYPPKKRTKNRTFTFGYAGVAHYRKGFDLLIRAFQEEFGPDDPVILLIRSDIPSSELPDDPRISVLGKLQADDMRAFYQSLDCFVFPTRGDGFGLTALEAMACGTCVALTRYGGQADYIGEYCIPVEVSGVEPCESFYDCKGNFITPSLSSLRQQMRWAYENRKDCWDMGIAAAEAVKANWTYAHTAVRIAELLKEIDPAEQLDLHEVPVVVWRGNPRIVTNRAGRFVRNIAVEVTPEKAELLRSNNRFEIQTRLRRK